MRIPRQPQLTAALRLCGAMRERRIGAKGSVETSLRMQTKLPHALSGLHKNGKGSSLNNKTPLRWLCVSEQRIVDPSHPCGCSWLNLKRTSCLASAPTQRRLACSGGLPSESSSCAMDRGRLVAPRLRRGQHVQNPARLPWLPKDDAGDRIDRPDTLQDEANAVKNEQGGQVDQTSRLERCSV